MIKHNRHYFMYLIILGLGFSTTSLSVGAEKTNFDQQIPSINRLPTAIINLSETDISLPANYPKQFDVIGVINDVSRVKGYIDVLAHHYPLSPAARYYKLNSTLNSLNDMKKGTIVGLILDSKNRVSAIYEVPSPLYKPS